MGERAVPITGAQGLQPLPRAAVPADGRLVDRRQRPLRDLRISVTDRCNFRCTYCMPKEVFGQRYPFLPHAALLSFEELSRVAAVFLRLGVHKLRLTGGEPLMRKDLEHLVGMLAALRTPDGSAPDITLTTNGSMLERKAQALRGAGLQRVTVSLDALDDAIFRRMNDVDFPVAKVLDGIEAARAAGLGPIKVNMVVKRGTNDHEIERMAEHFRGSGVVLRFIEFMDVGSTNGWRMDEVLPSAQILQRLQRLHPLEPVAPTAVGETARRWRWTDGGGEIGLISSVTRPFCGDCNRARLSTEGRLFLCLFATSGFDLRALLRAGASDEELAQTITGIWQQREDRYSELRHAGAAAPAGGERRIEMHYIGG